jgi:hypothetical protein
MKCSGIIIGKPHTNKLLMNTQTIFTAGFALALAVGCSTKHDPSPNITPSVTTTATATLGGASFNATDNTATDTGNGLQIKMTSGDKTITLITDDNKAGTYTMINATGARVMAGSTAYGTYSTSTDMYISQDGTVTITIDATGKITAAFSLNAKNSTANAISITDGKVEGLTVKKAAAPAGKCLMDSVYVIGSETDKLVYDVDGRLLKVVRSDGSFVLYLWANGEVVSHYDNNSDGGTLKEDWFYTNGKLSKTVGSRRQNGSTETYSIEFILNADGKPAKTIKTEGIGTPLAVTYTYDSNGNCTKADYGNNLIEVYSGYDNKPHSYSPLWIALGITFEPTAETGYLFSKNNVGSVSFHGDSPTVYTYTYDVKGNVTSITQSYQTISSQTNFAYTCN